MRWIALSWRHLSWRPGLGGRRRLDWPLRPRPAVVRNSTPPSLTGSRGHRGVDLPGTRSAGVSPRPRDRGVRRRASGPARWSRSPILAGCAPAMSPSWRRAGRPAGRRRQMLGELQAGHPGCDPAACLHWGAMWGPARSRLRRSARPGGEHADPAQTGLAASLPPAAAPRSCWLLARSGAHRDVGVELGRRKGRCPSSSWTTRRSAPPSRRSVAALWRTPCGPISVAPSTAPDGDVHDGAGLARDRATCRVNSSGSARLEARCGGLPTPIPGTTAPPRRQPRPRAARLGHRRAGRTCAGWMLSGHLRDEHDNMTISGETTIRPSFWTVQFRDHRPGSAYAHLSRWTSPASPRRCFR